MTSGVTGMGHDAVRLHREDLPRSGVLFQRWNTGGGRSRKLVSSMRRDISPRRPLIESRIRAILAPFD